MVTGEDAILELMRINGMSNARLVLIERNEHSSVKVTLRSGRELRELAVISNYTDTLVFLVSELPMTLPEMTLNETPVQIGSVILTIAAVAFKKRMGGWLGNVTGEWEE